MPILLPSAKFSTFVPPILPMRDLIVNGHFCVLMVPSSTKTTSFVIGGLTLTVLKLKVFMDSMIN